MNTSSRHRGGLGTTGLMLGCLVLACSPAEPRLVGGDAVPAGGTGGAGGQRPSTGGAGGGASGPRDGGAPNDPGAMGGSGGGANLDGGPGVGNGGASGDGGSGGSKMPNADAGASTGGNGQDAAPPPPKEPNPQDFADGDRWPVVVAVTNEGTRLASQTLGKTWGHRVALAGTPDGAALQGVTWGAGTFVAVGNKIFTSPDGITWTERANDHGWLQAVAYGNGRFVAVGGGYTSAWSTDGATWTRGEPVQYAGSDYNINTIVFDGADFFATGVNGGPLPGYSGDHRKYRVYRTKDAEARGRAPDGTNPTWTFVEEIVSADPGIPSMRVCDGKAKPWEACGPSPFHGYTVWLRGSSNRILRSLDGRAFGTVHTETGGYLRAFAFGYGPKPDPQ